MMTPQRQLEVLARILKKDLEKSVSSVTWAVKSIDEFQMRLTKKDQPCEGLDIYITVLPEHKQVHSTVSGMIEGQMSAETRPGKVPKMDGDALEGFIQDKWRENVDGLLSGGEISGEQAAGLSGALGGDNIRELVDHIRKEIIKSNNKEKADE